MDAFLPPTWKREVFSTRSGIYYRWGHGSNYTSS
jgi:hypothetical protein